MQYLCLIYEDEKEWQKMPKAETEKIINEFSSYTESVRQSGHYVGGNALQPTHTATTVRVRQGRVATTDGPFAETKEQLGGYYLLQARDLNEAIQLASRIPGARFGAVEVRPVVEM
ncbi:MAG: YciI family protein [Steroidobacteraceae bacterium]